MATTTKREYRERLDTVLLITAFIGGVGASLTLKVMGFPPYIPAVAAGAVIIVYAVATYTSSAARLEPEQIGDNSYYLGFCITLASLAYTLYSLGSAANDAAILGDVISGFGVALSSTVVGVMTRVVLLQFRVDLVARDKEARSQLNQVMRSFHSEMQASVSSTREAIVQIRQTLEEHTEATIKNNMRMQASYETRIEALVGAAVSGVTTAMQEVVDSGKDMNKRLSASSRVNMAAAEKVITDAIESITENLRSATESLETEIQRTNARSAESLEKMVMEVSAVMKLTSEEASKAIAASREQQNTEMTNAAETLAISVSEMARQIGAQKEKIGVALEDYTKETRAVRKEVGVMLEKSVAAREQVQTATEKMILAAETIQKSNKTAVSVATPQDGQPPSSQVPAKHALEADRTPPTVATLAVPANSGTQSTNRSIGAEATSAPPDATTAVKPTQSGDTQIPLTVTPTAPAAQHQSTGQLMPMAAPPVSDLAEPSTSTTQPSKGGWSVFGNLFKSR